MQTTSIRFLNTFIPILGFNDHSPLLPAPSYQNEELFGIMIQITIAFLEYDLITKNVYKQLLKAFYTHFVTFNLP